MLACIASAVGLSSASSKVLPQFLMLFDSLIHDCGGSGLAENTIMIIYNDTDYNL